MWKCPKCGREFMRTRQNHYCGVRPVTVDEYIAAQDAYVRPVVMAICETVRSAIPEAAEGILWGMPNWKKNHNLLQLVVNRKYIGFYPGKEAVEHFRDRLADYETANGNIKLPLDKGTPFELIADIAKWCWDND